MMKPHLGIAFCFLRLTRTQPMFHVASTMEIQPGDGENESEVEENISPENALRESQIKFPIEVKQSSHSSSTCVNKRR
jgi:hypothetical protein